MIKSELREIYLAKQKALSDVEKGEKSRKIADRFFERFELKNIRFLHVFLPIEKNGEIETRLIINRLWKGFPRVATLVSRVDFQTISLEHLKLTPDTKLAQNKWNILEPEESEIVEIDKIDLVLIPLLAFDESGFRVGYGKGFYDRFLKNCRADCLKIGLSYFAPVEKISDAQEFDVKLDFCVTPELIFNFKA